jgi:hypothetical protein
MANARSEKHPGDLGEAVARWFKNQAGDLEKSKERLAIDLN